VLSGDPLNILVTGSAGYIGTVLVPVLRAAGHTVLGYDIGWFGRDTASQLSVVGDIRDHLVREGWPDVVVHLAGLSNDPMGDLSPALTYGINKWGTLDVITSHPDARHVVVSSCAVYGQADDLCTEETKVNPLTVYARCKAEVDEWVTSRRTLDYAILRLGTVYGRSPNQRLDLVVSKMVRDARTTGRLTVSGNAARPLTHIEDVASAIAWAATADNQGIYNVVGENIRMHALGRLVSDVTGARVDSMPGGPDSRDYMASGEALTRAGWHPSRTLAAVIPALALASEPLDGHVRLDQLRALMGAGALDKQLRFAA
jgi:nucleoside-diphosphate-sugar epimerase